MFCPRCGRQVAEEASYCSNCGAPIRGGPQSFLIATTPTIPGYKIKKVLGVVTGLSPRTRGLLGKFVAGFQSVMGGEVTAFTAELEKARAEAIERAKERAVSIGANAIVGLDLETSDIGLQAGITVISATGTAVVVEPES